MRSACVRACASSRPQRSRMCFCIGMMPACARASSAGADALRVTTLFAALIMCARESWRERERERERKASGVLSPDAERENVFFALVDALNVVLELLVHQQSVARLKQLVVVRRHSISCSRGVLCVCLSLTVSSSVSAVCRCLDGSASTCVRVRSRPHRPPSFANAHAET